MSLFFLEGGRGFFLMIFLSDLLSGLAYAALWCSQFSSFKGKSNFYLKLCMRGHLAHPFVIASVGLNVLASLHPFQRIIKHVIIYMLYCIRKAKCFPFIFLLLFTFMKLAEHPTVRSDAPLESPKALGMAALGQEFGAIVTKTSTLHRGTGRLC